jgi:hypothetical protein
MKFADLHLHSVFSDGTSTPEELIEQARKSGLSTISIVDHDTVLALDPADAAGKEKNIEVLSGIELTAEYEGLEIHILGYLIDYKNKQLLDKLEFLKKNRIERIYKIVDKLKEQDIEIKPETIFGLSSQGTIGRLHVARTMVKQGVVSSVFEAFQKYIGDKCPAYVLNFKLSPQESIELIKSVGGIPVLAHPYILNRDDLIPKFLDFGLMGLEAYYIEHSRAMINSYLGLAKRYNLLVTGGSDYHGYAKPEVMMGAAKIPYELVEKLKEAKNK